MKAIVLGAGGMGSALAFDLARSKGVESVTIADRDRKRVQAAAKAAAKSGTARVRAVTADLASEKSVRKLVRGHDVAVGAADYALNLIVTRAAIAERVHACDLGGNIHVVEEQLKLGRRAERAGICVIPDCGVAPGMAVVLAAHAHRTLGDTRAIRIRCGGLPAHPKPPLNYKLVFSVRGLLVNYLEPSEALRAGKLTRLASLSELEPIDFPPPFGRLEAAITSWGSSTLPRTLAGKVQEVDYKTIRYPGHFEAFHVLRDLGLLDDRPVAVGDGRIAPLDLTAALIDRRLRDDDTDVLLLRVTAEGARERIVYEVIDRHDAATGHSAMMRCTAYPTSVVAQLLGTGEVTARGVVPGETSVPSQRFLAEIRARGIPLTERRDRI